MAQSRPWPASGYDVTEWLPVTPAGVGTDDPNRVELWIGGNAGSHAGANIGIHISGKNNIALKNIDLVGFGYGARVDGTIGSGPSFYGIRLIAQNQPSLAEDAGHSGNPYEASGIFGGGTNTTTLLVDRCEFWGGLPEWIACAGLKGSGLPELSCRANAFMLPTTDGNTVEGTMRHTLLDGHWSFGVRSSSGSGSTTASSSTAGTSTAA